MESSALRRRTMQAVKSKDTGPELLVRRLLHARGYRYRLHKRDLPGRPDIVFPGRRKVIFIHGCFWHGHHCRRGARVPKSNTDYWTAKIARNRARDQAARKRLKAKGWIALVLWECELRDKEMLARRAEKFLH
jgi:DNA mismatch endonuclease (patch repair protein)